MKGGNSPFIRKYKRHESNHHLYIIQFSPSN